MTEFSDDEPRNDAEGEESPATESAPETTEPAGDTPREAADQAASAPADEDELEGGTDAPSGDADAPPAGAEGAGAVPPPAAPEPPEAYAPPEGVPPQAAAPLDAAPPAEEPSARLDPAVEPESAPAAGAPDDPAAVQEQPTQAASPGPVADGSVREADDQGELDEDLTPRQRPEIPGADLIPDIVPEGEQFLDAEAQAAAEAEAEAAAARAQDDPDDHAMPIADAAIDLAAGARYTATGKRKTAVARVTLKPGTGTYAINGKALDTFFPREPLQRMIRQPLETVGYDAQMDVVARMHGGGVAAQAGALRLGISRALIVADPNLRGELKRRGFLTRDPRVKERKKAGLKKARKRPQFSKR